MHIIYNISQDLISLCAPCAFINCLHHSCLGFSRGICYMFCIFRLNDLDRVLRFSWCVFMRYSLQVGTVRRNSTALLSQIRCLHPSRASPAAKASESHQLWSCCHNPRETPEFQEILRARPNLTRLTLSDAWFEKWAATYMGSICTRIDLDIVRLFIDLLVSTVDGQIHPLTGQAISPFPVISMMHEFSWPPGCDLLTLKLGPLGARGEGSL